MALCVCAVSSSGQARRVLWIGDSITDGGWGRSGGDDRPSERRDTTDMNHIYGHSFMMLCASRLQSELWERDLRCYNRGISGQTLRQMAERWAGDCLALRPDVVSILIGTNDVEYALSEHRLDRLDLAAWTGELRGLLRRTSDELPGVRLVLCTPFVARAGWRGSDASFTDRERVIDLMAIAVRNLAVEFGATLVDFNALFKALHAERPPRTDYWIWDGVHPTPAGHQRMAELWLAQTRRLF